MRLRASTPAAYQVVPLAATHLRQAPMCTSARAWKLAPSARIRQAWSRRKLVLSLPTGGIEM
jgi:hypothetical protein